MAKTPKYVSSDGCTLAINERVEGIYIAWYIPEDGDFGGYIGEGAERDEEPSGNDLEAWENWAAYQTIKIHADGKNIQGFFFNTIRKARTALAAANETLTTKSRPWPSWAIQAKEAGWTPPEGWKP